MFLLSQKIREAREDAGLKQSELADAISINRVTISNYELGKVKKYSKKIIQLIAEKTGKPYNFFINEKKDELLKDELNDDFLCQYQHVIKLISGLNKEKISALITLLQ